MSLIQYSVLLCRLVSVDSSFQQLTLQCKDAAQRQHLLKVFLNTQVITFSVSFQKKYNTMSLLFVALFL